MRILVATTNPGKLREFSEILSGGDGTAFKFESLSSQPNISIPEETGRTFIDNACLKASHYARLFNTYALADDSGLSVDALAGKPGIHSARWAQMHGGGGGDADNNALLLRQLADIPDTHRTARFICALALSDAEGRILLTASDAVEGRVLHDPRGQNGFGYDPLFLIDELNRTTAELPPAEKHAISHRGRALRRMRAMMDRVGFGLC